MPFGPAPTLWRLKVKLMFSEEPLKKRLRLGEPFVVNHIHTGAVGSQCKGFLPVFVASLFCLI